MPATLTSLFTPANLINGNWSFEGDGSFNTVVDKYHGTELARIPNAAFAYTRLRSTRAFCASISHFARSQASLFCDPSVWDRIHIVHCGVAEPEPLPPMPAGRRGLAAGSRSMTPPVPGPACAWRRRTAAWPSSPWWAVSA